MTSLVTWLGSRRPAVCAAALLAGAAVLAGCSSTSSVLGSASSGVSSVGDRFSELFGGSKSQAVGETPPAAQAGEIECPPVAIRTGASTLSAGLKGPPANNNEVRYQLSITRTARECAQAGPMFTAKIGVQGRIIAGPAGAPPTVDVPLRIAVVREGPDPKTIDSKFYVTQVAVTGDGGSFSFVAEDISYPVPKLDEADAYVYYVGFDPAGAKPARPTKPSNKKR